MCLPRKVWCKPFYVLDFNLKRSMYDYKKMVEGFILNQTGAGLTDQSLMRCTTSAGSGSKFC